MPGSVSSNGGEGRRANHIPGYSGHIPNKGPENVFGKTWQAANSSAGAGAAGALPLQAAEGGQDS
eukprot:CAMPEP_0180804524 /NCGR_PEP_ID=MMETSP1038_2-20121128/61503_1 /TAXON_ID=632150 /ORGANISM="Azadinium spinosum, Strain 3D9" /LENGTH=64 /DNA_ID=CAMNT_0022844965 /DNA_START=81 /DNA_END=272 /DNA_ORIENTATION=-